MLYWLCYYSCPNFSPLYHPSPCTPFHPAFSPLSLCLWVVHISSLASALRMEGQIKCLTYIFWNTYSISKIALWNLETRKWVFMIPNNTTCFYISYLHVNINTRCIFNKYHLKHKWMWKRLMQCSHI